MSYVKLPNCNARLFHGPEGLILAQCSTSPAGAAGGVLVYMLMLGSKANWAGLLARFQKIIFNSFDFVSNVRPVGDRVIQWSQNNMQFSLKILRSGHVTLKTSFLGGGQLLKTWHGNLQMLIKQFPELVGDAEILFNYYSGAPAVGDGMLKGVDIVTKVH